MITSQLRNINGINGEIFAAEPLHSKNTGSFIKSYGNGYGDTFVIDEHKDAWIANGCNDSIPYLHRLIYRRSTIHNSSVNIKANLIQGSGLEFYPLERYYKKNQDGVFELIERSYTESERDLVISQAEVFAKNIGLGLFRKKASSQLALYGGYYKLSGYGLDSKGNEVLKRLFVEGYTNARMSAKREWFNGDFESKYYYFSNDWTTATPYKVISYDKFINGDANIKSGAIAKLSSDSFGDTKGTGFKAKFCGRVTDYRNYYAHPDYEAMDALTYMDIDYMISQRDFKDLESGFSLDHIIVRYRSKKDAPDEEKRLKNAEREFVKKNFKGYNGERSMLTWAEPVVTDNGSIETPKLWDVIEIPHNNNPERFNTLREERIMKILNAHTIISGEIIGLPKLSQSGLSSQSEYLIAAQKQLYSNVIEPVQSYLKEDIQSMFIDAGIPVGVNIKSSAANFMKLSEQMIRWAWGKDEIREIFGSTKMTEEVAKELELITQKSNNNGGQL